MVYKAMKKARKSIGRALGRRYVKKNTGRARMSNLNYNQISKDVMMLKNIVNAEKKSYGLAFTNQNVGQVNANNTGALCYDITPLIPQGQASDQRNGISVKLHSCLYQFQFTQLASLTIRQRLIIEFWINKGTYLTTATAQEYIHQAATFSTVIDTNSPRNQDRFSEFVCIRRLTRTIAPRRAIYL